MVIANFKETQIAKMRVNGAAEVTPMLFLAKHLKVLSFLSGNRSRFFASPDNSTGNFRKSFSVYRLKLN
ncbi:hypothetical protein CS542_02850 [Pedobacter sp. IW39]|nr:hypothetical protein CS542_02850 [Pedobacter sp. IW39]